MMRLRLFSFMSFVVLLSSPSWGQWQRVLYSGKGESRDVQSAHPLTYFTSNPCLRDDGGDLYHDGDNCGISKSGTGSANGYTVSTQTHDVGTLSGFRVVEIVYEFGDRRQPELEKLRWKSILVQNGRDLYAEIYHLQAYLRAPFTPAKLVHVGDELVLMTQDSDGGNGVAVGRGTGGSTLMGRSRLIFLLWFKKLPNTFLPLPRFGQPAGLSISKIKRLSLMFKKPMQSVGAVIFWAK